MSFVSVHVQKGLEVDSYFFSGKGSRLPRIHYDDLLNFNLNFQSAGANVRFGPLFVGDRIDFEVDIETQRKGPLFPVGIYLPERDLFRMIDVPDQKIPLREALEQFEREYRVAVRGIPPCPFSAAE